MKRLVAVAVVLYAQSAHAQDFSYLPPGDLAPSSGDGRVDDKVYAPTMLFPIVQLPAFANSQVYGHGGSQGPGGGQCDTENYSFPWRDNYCEIRTWDMPLCPAGTGHQGQDIRPSTCEQGIHAVQAVEDGTITNIGSYSVYLTAADGTRFDYLHMSDVAVSVGQAVARGAVIGMVSNAFGGTPTTIHLHFNIRQFVEGVGTVYVPPYTSLVQAYEGNFVTPVDGALEAVGCDAIVGWAYDPADPETPIAVTLSFDGGGAAHDVLADVYRGDLCENLGFCDHGFDVASPLSLFDDAAHDVGAALPGSPLTLQCAPPELAGARRPLSDDDYLAWGMSAFWDEPPITADEVEALPVGDAAPASREVWRVGDEHYVVDGSFARPIDAWSIRAWRLADAIVDQPDVSLAIGAAWPIRPVIVRDAAGAAHFVDVAREEISGVGGAEEDDDVDDGGASASAGCGCAAPGEKKQGSALWLAAVALLLGRRQRRLRDADLRPRTKPSAVRG